MEKMSSLASYPRCTIGNQQATQKLITRNVGLIKTPEQDLLDEGNSDCKDDSWFAQLDGCDLDSFFTFDEC